MDLNDCKQALLYRRPLVVQIPLLGDVFRAEATAVIYKRSKEDNKKDVEVLIETRDAFANSLMISIPEKVRFATPEEIKDYYINRKDVKHIKPTLYYDKAKETSVYRYIKDMSLVEMAKFILKIRNKEIKPFCEMEHCKELDSEGYCTFENTDCFRALLNWLESEVAV